MFKHIVCFRFEDKKEAPVVKVKIEALVGKVNTLRALEVGLDVLQSERSYDLVIIAAFDDRDGYETYAEHPDHVAVSNYIAEVHGAAVAVDYLV